MDRLDALEQEVHQLTSRLAGWVEAQLVQSLEARRGEMNALRSELQAAVSEQLAGIRTEQASLRGTATRGAEEIPERLTEVEDRIARRLAELHDQVEARLSASAERQQADVDALRAELLASPNEGPRRPDGLEQRVRAAMSRLSESVESKLAEAAAARQREAEGLRAEIANTATALRARFSQAQERIDEVERKYGEAETHVAALVETKLSEVVDRRRTEFDQLSWELREDLAKQVGEARTDIGTTVSEAHRRFLLSVERLDELVATVREELAADGRRIEALEIHTRRTDERLTELVHGKLAEVGGDRLAELEEFRGQLRTALDTHLADTRVEVSTTTGAARQELGELQAALDREVSHAVARLESLGLSVQDRLREAEASVAAAVAARLSELDPVADGIEQHRAEVAGLAEQFRSLAEVTRKAAFADDAILAPLRSDVRRLQDQLAELAELMYEVRPRRKRVPVARPGDPVLPAVRPVRTAAPVTKAGPVMKAVPVKKVAAGKKVAPVKEDAPVKEAAPRRRRAQ